MVETFTESMLRQAKMMSDILTRHSVYVGARPALADRAGRRRDEANEAEDDGGCRHFDFAMHWTMLLLFLNARRASGALCACRAATYC